jgi:hypothetical protein
MKKNALFVFNGDPVCFVHVLLNALDMKDRGHEIKIIIEGAATKLIPELAKKQNPMHTLWEKTQDQNLIEGVCKACSNKMGTAEKARSQGFALLDDMAGHPGMSRFQNAGFDIIVF